MTAAVGAFTTVDTFAKFLGFSGSLVAYQTGAAYYGSESGYPLDGAGADLKFGLVSQGVVPSTTGSFYNICQLLKPDEDERFTHIVHECLFAAHGPLQMRVVTSAEKRQIKAALDSGRAKIGIPSEEASIRERVHRAIKASLV